MCLLICLRRPDGSTLLAANRDEYYDRPSRPPRLWATRPRVLAGRDEQAGGTWLAVNEHGVAAAVTNRHDGQGIEALPSRGHLPLLACRHASAERARDFLATHLARTRYNGFNLLVADAAGAWIVQAPAGEVRIDPVGLGLGVVGNYAWDAPADPRVVRARQLLSAGGLCDDGERMLQRLADLCRDHHAADPAAALCLHGAETGTRSSTLIQLGPAGRLVTYRHAAGPPCRTDYQVVPDPFGGL